MSPHPDSDSASLARQGPEVEHAVTNPTVPEGWERFLPGAGTFRPAGRARAALVVGGLAVLLALGWALFQAGASWLHRQPERQVLVEEIALRPQPPAWIKGGSATILRQVQEKARWSDRLDVLDTDMAGLARAFALHCPWVENVRRVTRLHPNRLEVELSYKVPVAEVPLPGGESILLDRNGVVLPASDVDLVALGPLPRVEGLLSPFDARAGLPFREGGETPQDRRAVAAGTLAGFLADHRDDTPSPLVRVINVKHGAERLMVRTSDGLWAHWGEPPGLEPLGGPVATARWSALIDWIKRNPLPARPDHAYLDVSGLEPRLVRSAEAASDR